jgi:putative membrane protein
MALELLVFALAGCVLGTITGLLPGLHINSVALLALSVPLLDNTCLMILIASMSVTHSFVDFIPSVLLGAPDNDTFLAMLPGHRLLLQGKGFVAVRLTIIGGLFTGLASIAVAPIFVLFIEKNTAFLTAIVPFVLTIILAAMVFGERGKQKKLLSLAAIVLSGFLGILALKSNLPLQQPLFCLATGFFGASTLLDSIMKKTRLAKQLKKGIFVEKGRVAKNALLALFGGCLVSLMPGIGASQAAFIVRKTVGRIKTTDYLILLGGVNTATMILSFFVLFAWGKTRTGAAVAISQLADFGLRELLLVAAACLVGIGFASIATDLLARPAVRILQALDYRKINIAVLGLITVLVFAFSSFLGLAFYAIAASVGIFSLNNGIKRSNSMAFLMIPTIMHYLALT